MRPSSHTHRFTVFTSTRHIAARSDSVIFASDMARRSASFGMSVTYDMWDGWDMSAAYPVNVLSVP
ncbi:hypothetical protein GCM10010151_41040 [Actinoallomurus spadix]|uniref:Uncharacterized protein n=1 Tax=Actinoallomurus spadix TaxID=79912 RepID=A0ABP3GMQ6_9ACTN